MAILTTATDIHLRSSSAMGQLARAPFSVTVWLNGIWNPGSRRSFVGIYGPATDVPLATPITAMQIGTSTGVGELTFWTWGGGTLTGTATGVMTAYNNLWVHVTYTYDGTNHRGYVNGVQVCTSTTTQLAGYLNQVYVNGYPGGGINEVAVYQCDSYAFYGRTLSPDEVLTIYTTRGARHGIGGALLTKYEFDELPQGATVIAIPDFSGTGNILTPVGAGAAIQYTYTDTSTNANIRPVQ